MFDELEKKINYDFKNKLLLKHALTHSSYANEKKNNGSTHNERLEFLGDSVLSIVISEYLYNHHQHLEEGQLTKIRAKIVCEASLARAARQIGIGKFMFFGRGEELTGGRERVSILSDAFEAIIAAIYLDGQMEQAKRFIFEQMQEIISEACSGQLYTDFKTRLQEVVQVSPSQMLKYEIYKEEGPDHAKLFFTHVKLNDQIIGSGFGRSKKEAEQEAAREGLDRLEKK